MYNGNWHPTNCTTCFLRFFTEMIIYVFSFVEKGNWKQNHEKIAICIPALYRELIKKIVNLWPVTSQNQNKTASSSPFAFCFVCIDKCFPDKSWQLLATTHLSFVIFSLFKYLLSQYKQSNIFNKSATNLHSQQKSILWFKKIPPLLRMDKKFIGFVLFTQQTCAKEEASCEKVERSMEE